MRHVSNLREDHQVAYFRREETDAGTKVHFRGEAEVRSGTVMPNTNDLESRLADPLDRRPWVSTPVLEGICASIRGATQATRSLPDFANAQPGSYDPVRFAVRPRLSTYSLPSIGPMCGGSRSR
jgi:hypothetical protein